MVDPRSAVRPLEGLAAGIGGRRLIGQAVVLAYEAGVARPGSAV